MAKQLKEKAIPIFEAMHPGCVAVFAFDNSTNHGAYASDALLVNKMNLNSGGIQPKMRTTTMRDGTIWEMELPKMESAEIS
ncbi:14480_t:CDS:2 [Entrophospora sp. SA101]|nr:14480_t:CDS:2 [Entrophospora sp. SA101]